MSVWSKPRLVASPRLILGVLCQEDYEGLLTLERYGVPVKRFYATEQEMIEIGGRHGFGIELKPSYWRTAVNNCRDIEAQIGVPSLFDGTLL